jgi:hypothetical protein
MQKNPNQQAFDRFQKQNEALRQRQMQAAWMQQNYHAKPSHKSSGPMRVIGFLMTLGISGLLLTALCGGATWLAVALASQNEDTAVIGLIGGGIVGLMLAFIAASQTLRHA